MYELNIFCFVTNLITTVFIGVLLPIVPALTRKSFLFGVRIPPAENDSLEARGMKKRYITVCFIGAVIILALDIVQFATVPEYTLLAIMYFPFLFVILQFAAFIPNYKAALRLKKERNWQVSDSVFADTKSSFTRGNLSNMPWAWYIAGLLIIFVITAFSFARYPALPERIATHYGFDGEPDAWANKSIGQMLFLPVTNLVMLVFMWAVGVIFERAKLQTDTHKPALSFAQHRVYRRAMGHCIGSLALGCAVVLASINLFNLIDGFSLNFWTLHLPYIIPTVALCVVSIRCGQGGCRIKIREETLEAADNNPVANRNLTAKQSDDRFWALGMFYHNPDDPAVFVEDRFGGNFGLNYSHLAVKIGVILFVLATAGFYVWFTAWWTGSALQKPAPVTIAETRVDELQGYDATEEQVIVDAGSGYPLEGLITSPAGGANVALVLVHGSGPSDKDETIGANKPFRDIAYALAEKGVCVLRYDKRTFTYGAAIAADADALAKLTVYDETVDDAVAAVKLMKERFEKVYILGHSMSGGLLAEIGAKGADCDGYIVMAGTPRKLYELSARQNLLYADEIEANGDAGTARQIRDFVNTELAKAAQLPGMSNEDALKPENAVFTMSAWYLRSFEEIDTLALHSKDGKPILILQGGRDRQVTQEDFELWKTGLSARSGVTFKLYPALNHLMGEYKGEKVPFSELVTREYAQMTPVSAEMTSDIAEWILNVK